MALVDDPILSRFREAVTRLYDDRIDRVINEISRETEVWCADVPANIIHFNGERSLGLYEKDGQ